MRRDILSFWRAQHLPEGCTVTCAVSGGADSVALLHCLCALRSQLSITVRAAHYNHHLRGAESERDEAFVRSLCKTLNVPLTVSGGDVAAMAAGSGKSTEEAARHARYAFFASLGSIVATAHTADDNLETVLLNLLRGTGLDGLCGVPVRRDTLIRPMLCCTHRQALAYLAEHSLDHVEDSTNAQPNCLRNRLRQQVIPLLQAENPALTQSTLHMTQLLRQDAALLDVQARAVLDAAKSGAGWCCSVFLSQPEAIRTRAIRALLLDAGVSKLTHRHIEAVCALLAANDPSVHCDLPGGLTAMRQYGQLLLTSSTQPVRWQETPLPLDTWVQIPGGRIHCTRTSALTAAERSLAAAALRTDVVDLPTLCVRPRRTGDTIRLPGGTKTLKRLFIDRKIPQPQRDLLPIVADSHGVLAVPGLCAHQTSMAGIGDDALIIKIEKEDTSRYD